jgi:hypothetical protein
MARMVLPERLVGAMFLGWAGLGWAGLGWVAGLTLPCVWIDAGAAPGALMLAGGLLYRPGRFLPSPPPRPVPVGVRLPRGLSRLRLRRRDVPVYCDSTVHQLSQGAAALATGSARKRKQSAQI